MLVQITDDDLIVSELNCIEINERDYKIWQFKDKET